jgi:hypothetical protein
MEEMPVANSRDTTGSAIEEMNSEDDPDTAILAATTKRGTCISKWNQPRTIAMTKAVI